MRGRCRQHPTAIFLLDIDCCPDCKASKENLIEYPIPVKSRDSAEKKFETGESQEVKGFK